MYRLMAAIAAALLVSASAFAQSAPPVTSYPAGWSPKGNTAALAVSNVSGRVVLGWVAAGPTSPPSVLVCNTGAVNAYVTLGGSTVTATTGGVLVAAGYCPLLALNGASYIAAITSSSTTTLSVMSGTGGSQSSLPGAGGPGSFMLSTASNAVLPDARTNLGLGTASDVAFRSLTLAPAASSLGQGMNITQSPSGSVSDAFNYLNLVNITSDNVNVSGGLNRVVGFGIEHKCCGASAQGERFSLSSQLVITSTGNAAGGVAQSYVSIFGLTRAEVAAPNASSSITAGNANVQMTGGATGWAQISGFEVDVTVLTGANPLTKVGLPIVLGTNDAVQGSSVDASILFLSTSTSTVGWKNLLLISQSAGVHNKTIATTGCVVCTTGTMTFATGIDLSGATITGNFLKGPSDFAVSGAGYLSLKRNQSIQFSTGGVTRNLARFLNASDTITFGDTDNGGTPPAAWSFASGAVTISSTTGSTSTTTGSLVAGGGLGVSGPAFLGNLVYGLVNSNATYPTSQAALGWAIGNNFSAASAEVNFWNVANGAGGFDWKQKTGASAATTMMALYAGLQVGAPTGGDKGAGTINAAGAYWANGTAGISKICVAAGATLTFVNGILTETAVC